MISLPPRLSDLWDWFSAVWAWDYNDPRPLANLIKDSGGNLPPEVVPVVADIVAGSRKPNRKAGAKLLVPAAMLGELAASQMLVRDLCGVFKRGASSIGERNRLQTIEVVRSIEFRVRAHRERSADRLSVTDETVQRVLREAEQRISRWPVL